MMAAAMGWHLRQTEIERELQRNRENSSTLGVGVGVRCGYVKWNPKALPKDIEGRELPTKKGS